MNLPFDKTYLLHLAEDKNRYKSFTNELNRLNIDYDIWWTCKRSISQTCAKAIRSLPVPYYKFRQAIHKDKPIMAGVFNCALEHYTIIKQSYLREMNSILIMEDDIKFIDNIEYISRVFDNIPEDYDLIKFWQTKFSNYDYDIYENEDNIYSKLTDFEKTESTLCYALSKNGMKKYIEIMDNKFLPSDNPFKYFQDMCCYELNYIICYPNSDLPSNIE